MATTPLLSDVMLEVLAEAVHKAYCKYHLDNKGEEYWTKGDYSLLDEATKQIDRETVIAVMIALGDYESDAMTFGHAIEAMKQGKKVARSRWNGKGMFIYHVPAQTYETTTEIGKDLYGKRADCGAYISMKPASGPLVIGWLASQTDILAEDWQVVE